MYQEGIANAEDVVTFEAGNFGSESRTEARDPVAIQGSEFRRKQAGSVQWGRESVQGFAGCPVVGRVASVLGHLRAGRQVGQAVGSDRGHQVGRDGPGIRRRLAPRPGLGRGRHQESDSLCARGRRAA